jgi:hypothetical protein
VQVTVSSLDAGAIKSNFIGSRVVKNDSEEESETEEPTISSSTIAGMEMGREAKAKKIETKQITDKEIKSGRDLKKLASFLITVTNIYFLNLFLLQIKKQTITSIKKSKIIQKKNQLNHKRNVKLSNRKKQIKEKFLKKHKKIPKHNR